MIGLTQSFLSVYLSLPSSDEREKPSSCGGNHNVDCNEICVMLSDGLVNMPFTMECGSTCRTDGQ